jgi:hypothetical protein
MIVILQDKGLPNTSIKKVATMKKVFSVFLSLLFICLAHFASVSSARDYFNLEFNGDTMSAELRDVSLRSVLERIQAEKGIRFNGVEALLEEKVSLRFENLPFEMGLKRILSRINYACVYDRDEKLVGLLLIGKSPYTQKPAEGRQPDFIDGNMFPKPSGPETGASADKPPVIQPNKQDRGNLTEQNRVSANVEPTGLKTKSSADKTPAIKPKGQESGTFAKHKRITHHAEQAGAIFEKDIYPPPPKVDAAGGTNPFQ